MIKVLRWRFRKYLGHLTGWLSKRFLKRCFLESGLTKFFTVCNSGNTLAMTIIFFFKMFEIWCRFLKSNKIFRKKIFPFQIFAFELGVANSCNVQQDTCHWQAMCQQIHLRFHLTLGGTFSLSTSLRVIHKHDKCAARELSQVFETLSHVDGQNVSWNDAF